MAGLSFVQYVELRAQAATRLRLLLARCDTKSASVRCYSATDPPHMPHWRQRSSMPQKSRTNTGGIAQVKPIQ